MRSKNSVMRKNKFVKRRNTNLLPLFIILCVALVIALSGALLWQSSQDRGNETSVSFDWAGYSGDNVVSNGISIPETSSQQTSES